MGMYFAETLRKLRTEKGLSQQELANQIHVTRSTVARWENGSRLPDAMMILHLAKCLGMDANILLYAAAESDEAPKIIMIDDEKIILDGEIEVLREVLPDAEIHGFTEPHEAKEFLNRNKVRLAFLDIEIGRISGFDLCQELLEIEPHMNIFFLTAYPQYALDAWKTGACGFMEKPLNAEDVRAQLARLRFPMRGVEDT